MLKHLQPLVNCKLHHTDWHTIIITIMKSGS